MKKEFLNNFIIPFSLIIIALAIRSPGLGKWPLAEDEFYFSQSVHYIIEKGVPEFPAGGYYTRGIGLQYISALPVLIFKNREFALRLIPLIFGIITIPLFYKICTLFLPVSFSVSSSIILLLSSWHIEFSRFARFYMPFQLVFLAFTYYFYIGYWKDRKNYRIISWIIGILSMFVYEGCIFIPLLILAFLLLEDDLYAKRFELLSVSFLFLFLAYMVNHFDYGKIAVNPFPIDYATASKSVFRKIPILFPNFNLFQYVGKTPSFLLGYISTWIFSIYIFVKQRKRFAGYTQTAIFGLILFFPLIHQYGLLFCCLIIVFLFNKNIQNIYIKNINILILSNVVTGLFWVFILYQTDNLNYALHYMFGFPPIKNNILKPIFSDFPIWGTLIFLPFLISIIRNILKKNNEQAVFILKVILILLIIMPMFRTPWVRTRYIFFFFPLFLLIAHTELFSGVKYFLNRNAKDNDRIIYHAICLIPVAVFFISEDFNYKHITNVASEEANYRIGKYSKYFYHWYPRVDFENPSRFVNSVYKNGDIIVLDFPTMSVYLEKPYVNFVSIKNKIRFPYHSRKYGTEEKWTGKPLIYSYDELNHLVPNNKDNVLWLLSVIDEKYNNGGSFIQKPYTPVDIGKRFNFFVDLKFVGHDERIGVWELKR